MSRLMYETAPTPKLKFLNRSARLYSFASSLPNAFSNSGTTFSSSGGCCPIFWKLKIALSVPSVPTVTVVEMAFVAIRAGIGLYSDTAQITIHLR
jgi:hypothetical protein